MVPYLLHSLAQVSHSWILYVSLELGCIGFQSLVFLIPVVIGPYVRTEEEEIPQETRAGKKKRARSDSQGQGKAKEKTREEELLESVVFGSKTAASLFSTDPTSTRGGDESDNAAHTRKSHPTPLHDQNWLMGKGRKGLNICMLVWAP
jgi:hypothetical protein